MFMIVPKSNIHMNKMVKHESYDLTCFKAITRISLYLIGLYLLY